MKICQGSLFFLSSIIVIEMMMFLFIFSGCKGRHGIFPVLPDENNNSPSQGYYPDERSSSGASPYVQLIGTGPSEYLDSKLDPPHITNSHPVFSARVDGSITPLSSDNFIVTIGNEQVPCSFNYSTNEVQFAPKDSLKDGVHFARLFFKNPDGHPIDMYWNFMIETTTPEIQWVMWSEKDKSTLVIFNRMIEPSLRKFVVL